MSPSRRLRWWGVALASAVIGPLLTTPPAGGDHHGPWSVATLVPGGLDPFTVRAVVDDQGTVTVAWGTNNSDISVARRSPDGQWGPVEEVVPRKHWLAELGLGRDGIITMLFVGRRTLFVTSRDPATGSWSEPHELGELAWVSSYDGVSSVNDPRLDTNGPAPVVVWGGRRERYVMFSSRRADGSWSKPRRVSRARSLGTQPAVAVTRKGAAHVAWRRPGGEDGNQPLVMRTRRANGTWTPTRPVTSSGARNPVLSVAADGTTALGWTQGEEPGAAVRRPDRRWRMMPPPARPGDVTGMDVLALPRGRAFAAWTSFEYPPDPSDDFVTDLWVARGGGGEWGKPERLSWGGNNRAPDLVAGLDEDVHVVWSADPDGSFESALVAARTWSGRFWSPASFLTGNGGGSVDVDFGETLGCAVFELWGALNPGEDRVGRVGYSCQSR